MRLLAASRNLTLPRDLLMHLELRVRDGVHLSFALEMRSMSFWEMCFLPLLLFPTSGHLIRSSEI